MLALWQSGLQLSIAPAPVGIQRALALSAPTPCPGAAGSCVAQAALLLSRQGGANRSAAASTRPAQEGTKAIEGTETAATASEDDKGAGKTSPSMSRLRRCS